MVRYVIVDNWMQLSVVIDLNTHFLALEPVRLPYHRRIAEGECVTANLVAIHIVKTDIKVIFEGKNGDFHGTAIMITIAFRNACWKIALVTGSE